jgi:sensor histidine kinase YesM
MPTASARCRPADGRGDWRARFWAPRRSLPGPAASELRALGFVAAVFAVLVVLGKVVEFAVSHDMPTIDFARLTADIWEDLATAASLALTMFVVIQPVRRVAPRGGVRRVCAIVGALALATLLAVTIQGALMLLWGFPLLSAPYATAIQFGLPAAFLVTVAEFHRREVLSLEAMREAEADRARLEQQTLQARLKTLEAQIEPHFLFNTLANIRRLYEVDAVAGDAMLERMMRYLDIALPSMRDERVTLGREADLIEAYLDLQKVRMGRRLTFAIDVAPALRPIEVPPMMLLTLVENAIKHGLAPQRNGGRVDVGARREGGSLQLEVADTGGGFGSGVSGGGTGLANIQVRLAAMFGDAAQLTLSAREPHGLTAAIRIPLGA